MTLVSSTVVFMVFAAFLVLFLLFLAVMLVRRRGISISPLAAVSKWSDSPVRGKRSYNHTDLRLPYRKYVRMYPDSGLSYEQYKKLQAQNAYKRLGSSREIKRIVR